MESKTITVSNAISLMMHSAATAMYENNMLLVSEYMKSKGIDLEERSGDMPLEYGQQFAQFVQESFYAPTLKSASEVEGEMHEYVFNALVHLVGELAPSLDFVHKKQLVSDIFADAVRMGIMSAVTQAIGTVTRYIEMSFNYEQKDEHDANLN